MYDSGVGSPFYEIISQQIFYFTNDGFPNGQFMTIGSHNSTGRDHLQKTSKHQRHEDEDQEHPPRPRPRHDPGPDLGGVKALPGSEQRQAVLDQD